MKNCKIIVEFHSPSCLCKPRR